MYIMAKTYQNLELLARDHNPELSILESRKNNRANLCLAEDYNLRSTPKRMASAAKLVQFQRGLRKSSSLTNGMSPGKDKTALREYGTEARGLFCLHPTLTCQCAHPGHSLMRTVLRQGDEDET
jgi:hypothetical protein